MYRGFFPPNLDTKSGAIPYIQVFAALSPTPIHRVAQKLEHFSYALSSSNICQFSNLFHC